MSQFLFDMKSKILLEIGIFEQLLAAGKRSTWRIQLEYMHVPITIFLPTLSCVWHMTAVAYKH